MKRCILMLLLFTYGCVGVNVSNTITKCPAPKPPKYQQLDNATHIGSDKNLIFLMNDLNMMRLFMDSQNNTISCYEEQIPKKDEKK